MNESESDKKANCPMCGGKNTEEQGLSENSYGEFVTVHLCIDCDIEFETKK